MNLAITTYATRNYLYCWPQFVRAIVSAISHLESGNFIFNTLGSRDAIIITRGSSVDHTSGTLSLLRVGDGGAAFAPSSGTGNFIAYFSNLVVNQSGSASGYAALFEANPTMTSVLGPIYGFKSSLGTSSAGGGAVWNIYADGVAKNALVGLTKFGSTTASTAFVGIAAGVTGNAQMNLAPGVAPSSPVDGDIYYINTNDRLMFFKNATASEVISASAVTTEVVVSDTTLTVTFNGVSYKLLVKA